MSCQEMMRVLIRGLFYSEGTNYRYQSWQPIDNGNTSIGTKAPYYGNIAVASFMGNIVSDTPQIVNLPLPNEEESAYAAYTDGELDRMMVINLMTYNATPPNDYLNDYPRPVEKYEFHLPKGCHGKLADVQWLMANGSDAITGITFDAWSYNYELDGGLPVRLDNVTRGESHDPKPLSVFDADHVCNKATQLMSVTVGR
jgi:hypothetical protein